MVTQYVVTLANSIVGVSVLAMPFCFKQCGVILATLMLILGAIMTRVACYFLLKGATITRRRTYEVLAYQTFGPSGKFLVEIIIIGYLFGTLIAFIVVMGDLGPQIISEILAIENNNSLRTIVMTGLALFVALPLGLIRNIDNLSAVSTASFLFYFLLVLKILSEGLSPVLSFEEMSKINYWEPSGVLQSIPIFAMALSCQTQIFGIYDSLPEPSLAKMNNIVKQAVNICTLFYISIGFFGYIAFASQGINGNILLSFNSSFSTQLIKMCFVLSIAFSFPLIIFPCRASLHSLIFKGSVHELGVGYMSEGKLRILTIGIVLLTLLIGLLIPNIELVLGLVGSTAGSLICIILPSILFIQITPKNTTERLLAQAVFIIGLIIMVLTTYVTLTAVEQAHSKAIPKQNQELINLKDELIVDKNILINDMVNKLEELPNQLNYPKISSTSSSTTPVSKIIPSSLEPIASKKESVKYEKIEKIIKEIKEPDKIYEKIDKINHKSNEQIKVVREEDKNEQSAQIKSVLDAEILKEVPKKSEIVKLEKKEIENSPLKKDDEKIEINLKSHDEKVVLAASQFLQKLKENTEEQKKLLEEQKEILAELKSHQDKDHHGEVLEEKLKISSDDKGKKIKISDDNEGKKSKVNLEKKLEKLTEVEEEHLGSLDKKVKKTEESMKLNSPSPPPLLETFKNIHILKNNTPNVESNVKTDM